MKGFLYAIWQVICAVLIFGLIAALFDSGNSGLALIVIGVLIYDHCRKARREDIEAGVTKALREKSEAGATPVLQEKSRYVP